MDSLCKKSRVFLQFTKKLKNLWDWWLSEYGESDIKARVIGIKTQMKSFNFFFGIRLGHLVLSHSNNLGRTLQTPKISAVEAQKLSWHTVGTIEAHFNKFWHDMLSEATILEVVNLGKEKPHKELKNASLTMQSLSFIQIFRPIISKYIMKHLIL